MRGAEKVGGQCQDLLHISYKGTEQIKSCPDQHRLIYETLMMQSYGYGISILYSFHFNIILYL